MDPFDRFLRRSLDDVLVTQGILTRERADEMLSSATSGGVPFATVVLESGTVTAWDLARIVAVHYQMPVHPLGNYRFDKDVFKGLSPQLLHRHMAVPLSVLGKTRTFAVLEPPSRALLDELTKTCGPSVFFFVAEGPAITKVLDEHAKLPSVHEDQGWQKLFESAEQEVLKGLKKTRA